MRDRCSCAGGRRARKALTRQCLRGGGQSSCGNAAREQPPGRRGNKRGRRGRLQPDPCCAHEPVRERGGPRGALDHLARGQIVGHHSLTMLWCFGYNRRAKAQPRCGEQVKICVRKAVFPLRSMMRCSIRVVEWDPKRAPPKRACRLMLLTSKLIAKDFTATLTNVRVDLLTLVLITEHRGAA